MSNPTDVANPKSLSTEVGKLAMKPTIGTFPWLNTPDSVEDRLDRIEKLLKSHILDGKYQREIDKIEKYGITFNKEKR